MVRTRSQRDYSTPVTSQQPTESSLSPLLGPWDGMLSIKTISPDHHAGGLRVQVAWLDDTKGHENTDFDTETINAKCPQTVSIACKDNSINRLTGQMLKFLEGHIQFVQEEPSQTSGAK